METFFKLEKEHILVQQFLKDLGIRKDITAHVERTAILQQTPVHRCIPIRNSKALKPLMK